MGFSVGLRVVGLTLLFKLDLLVVYISARLSRGLSLDCRRICESFSHGRDTAPSFPACNSDLLSNAINDQPAMAFTNRGRLTFPRLVRSLIGVTALWTCEMLLTERVDPALIGCVERTMDNTFSGTGCLCTGIIAETGDRILGIGFSDQSDPLVGTVSTQIYNSNR